MKKLHKVEQGKMLCGVCTGIAAYFDIDPTLVRLGAVLPAGRQRYPGLHHLRAGDPERSG